MIKKITHLALIPFVYAQGQDISTALPNPLGKNSSIPCLIVTLAKWMVILAAVIVPVFIIIGAFQMLTSAGNPEKFKSGQKTILYAIIGFIIVIMARGITEIVKNALGANTGTLTC